MIGLLGKGLNSNTWGPLEKVLTQRGLPYRHLKRHQQISSKYSVVFSLGYDRLIPEEILKKPEFGVVVFHSSDLPEGRGWAPLFYTIMKKKKFLTQSIFYAQKGVDSGPIIAKAKYPINDRLTIDDLRVIDDELTVLLFKKSVGMLSRKRVKVKLQNHTKATYWKKRNPRDSQIKANMTVGQLYDFIRALPKEYAPFLEHKGSVVTFKADIQRTFKFSAKKAILKTYYGG